MNSCRLFTKLRNEFYKWSQVIEKNFRDGESRTRRQTCRVGLRRRTGEAGDAADEDSGKEDSGTGGSPVLHPTSRIAGLRASDSQDTERGF